MTSRSLDRRCRRRSDDARSSAQQAPDRSQPPAPGPPPALKLPAIQKRQLSNGLPVWIVELHEVPVVQVNLVVLERQRPTTRPASSASPA